MQLDKHEARVCLPAGKSRSQPKSNSSSKNLTVVIQSKILLRPTYVKVGISISVESEHNIHVNMM